MGEGLELAELLAEVSRDLGREAVESVTFERVAHRALDVVPACEKAGVAVRKRRRRIATAAGTRDAVSVLDELQCRHGEGPTLIAAFDEDHCLVPDVPADTAFPTWSPAAAAVGLGSALSVRLAVEEQTLGALTLYSSRPRAFDATTVALARVYAAHAALALASAKTITGLSAALESRHLIGMAQGVLAHRYGVSFDRAFEVLMRSSNDTNTKLRDVAAGVLENGTLPELEREAG
ncbi:GAF and ANTAR domain-containing protein [Nocardioides donggukensis]|uniref:GAF and ANTAR domain-containing protein n=1 Tax=Nocardioides donggukensis TaxID=2774019 RepID=A0A927K8F3_9ACTN|nr:GAF and ANTAR domain-containing protein [Nocardioides donggukensis]MBD8870893.1 GAF and ANTAR domain-containing protein [Nocardioides donggukensis]